MSDNSITSSWATDAKTQSFCCVRTFEVYMYMQFCAKPEKQVMIFLLFFCGEKNRGVCDLRIIFLWAKINDCWFQDGKQTRHCRERSQAGARRIINTRQWFNITVSTPFWVRTKKIILQGVTSYQTTTTKKRMVDNIITTSKNVGTPVPTTLKQN